MSLVWLFLKHPPLLLLLLLLLLLPPPFLNVPSVVSKTSSCPFAPCYARIGITLTAFPSGLYPNYLYHLLVRSVADASQLTKSRRIHKGKKNAFIVLNVFPLTQEIVPEQCLAVAQQENSEATANRSFVRMRRLCLDQLEVEGVERVHVHSS
jgi:hypothetical protein